MCKILSLDYFVEEEGADIFDTVLNSKHKNIIPFHLSILVLEEDTKTRYDFCVLFSLHYLLLERLYAKKEMTSVEEEETKAKQP